MRSERQSKLHGMTRWVAIYVVAIATLMIVSRLFGNAGVLALAIVGTVSMAVVTGVSIRRERRLDQRFRQCLQLLHEDVQRIEDR